MGDKITLKVDNRELHGKKVAQLRRQGLVPGIVYGHKMDPISVQAAQQVIEKIYKAAGKHAPVYLAVDGKNRLAMIKDVAVDPVKNRIRHISFHAVNVKEKVEAEVPVKLIGEGESPAEKAGLIVLQNIESLKVHALPTELPDALEVSIVNLAEPHDQLTVADIQLPEGVELDDPENTTDLVIASVYEPSALQAANDAAGGDAEPGDEAAIEAEQGEDTDQGGGEQAGNPGGKKAAEDKPS